MDLRRSDRGRLAFLCDLAKAIIHRIRTPHVKHAVAEAGADLAGTRPAIAHIDRDDVVGLARRDPHRNRFFDVGTLIFERHEVRKLVAALCIDKARALRAADKFAGVVANIDAEPCRCFRTDQTDIVPRDLV